MPFQKKLPTPALFTVFLLSLTACQPIQPLPTVTPASTLPEQATPTGTGLAAPDTASEILGDTWGVPHIFAQEPASAFYALGWAQTHSRGDLLLRLYASARGRGLVLW